MIENGIFNAYANKSRESFASLKLTEGLPKLLYMLICKGDGCTQAELATRCQVKASTLAILLKKLEKEKYIEKRRTLLYSGKSTYQIFLTDTGRDLAIAASAIANKIDEQCSEGFTVDEREQFRVSLAERNPCKGFFEKYCCSHSSNKTNYML